MDLPDFTDTDFTAHKGVKKRPTTAPPPEAGTGGSPPPDDGAPAKKKPGRKPSGGRKPGPGKGAPRHAPRTGKHPKRQQQLETRQKSHRWAKSGEWKPIFLEHLKETGHETAAAERAGVSRTTVYNHKTGDPEFKDDCEEALKVAEGRVYASIMEQAVKGDKKYVFVNGERKFLGRQRNALLAMFMMKKLDPTFRDSYDGGTGNAAVQMTQAIVNFLRFGDAPLPGSVEPPSFREFIDAGGGDAKALAGLPETPEGRVERLRAELAAAEAELGAT